MSDFTDKTIPMECPECNVLEEGVDSMMSHILDFHLHYTPEQAVVRARELADHAYDVEDRHAQERYENHKRSHR